MAINVTDQSPIRQLLTVKYMCNTYNMNILDGKDYFPLIKLMHQNKAVHMEISLIDHKLIICFVVAFLHTDIDLTEQLLNRTSPI